MSEVFPCVIIDNFLDQSEFTHLKKLIVDNVDFPWFITNNITGLENDGGKDYYFTHQFVKDYQCNSHLFDYLDVFKYKINMTRIIRIKANLYPSTEKIIEHSNHIDFNFKHKAAVFYLNTNDGFTIFQDSHRVSSIENRMVLFDGSTVHRSTTCTDQHYRVNLNFNYF